MDIGRENFMLRRREIGAMYLQAKNAWGYQKLEETREDPLSRIQRDHGPADTRIFPTSVFQNCEKSHLCYLSQPSTLFLQASKINADMLP